MRRGNHIAVLGNAMLAKASNIDVDPFSLKVRDDSPGAYNARGISDEVLAPWASEVGLNIGALKANPLNNSPFYGAVRVSVHLPGVKDEARPALEELCAVLTEVSRIHNVEAARQAVRAFIEVRHAYSLTPPTYEISLYSGEVPMAGPSCRVETPP